MYSHYCFEGIIHNDRCACNCPSCSFHETTIVREEFNRRLSDRIREVREHLFMEVIKDHKARNVLIEELKKEPKPPTIPKYGVL